MPRNQLEALIGEVKTIMSSQAPANVKAAALESVRERNRGMSSQLDVLLLQECERARKGLFEVRQTMEQLKNVLDRVTSPPWHLGIFIRHVETLRGTQALVSTGRDQQILEISPDLEVESLLSGDEVFLSKESNVVLQKAEQALSPGGETAHFDRYLRDGRIVVRSRDEELICDASAALSEIALEAYDAVRFDRNARMAFERIEKPDNRDLFLSETPDVARDRVGGQDENVDKLIMALTGVLVDPEGAAAYGLSGRASIIMIGPPGCGKTLMVRVAASEIGRLTGEACNFVVIKPRELYDPYVGVTEANIRNIFKAAREANGPTVIFMDEIESVGRIRGGVSALHHDGFLNALLAEIEGFDSSHDKVAIVSATNRKDLIDPALLERLSQVELNVDRPNLEGARTILNIHFPESLPYHCNGNGEEQTRNEIIESCVSQLYSPNGDNEITVLRFRDGTSRRVFAREICSGRVLEQISRLARHNAFTRKLRGGESGLTVADMDEALASTLERLRTTLSPRNAHAFLHDLSTDLDVVAAQPVRSQVTQSHRYLTLEVA